MLRNLIVVCVLALSGCVSYSDARYGAREPVYSDGSYYSPSAEGYGDYYYAPESYGYHDDFGYDAYRYSNRYYRGPFWMSGQSPWCSYGYRYGYVYRPCSYGYGYGRPWGGWGLSLFFGDRWGGWGGWGGGWDSWPYDRHRRWYRDRDRNDHDHDDDDRDADRARQPRPPFDGDRNRRYPDSGIRVPSNDGGPRVRPRPDSGDRNQRGRNERPVMQRPDVGVPPGNDRNAWRTPPPRAHEDGRYAGGRIPADGSRNGAPPSNRPAPRVDPRPAPVERPHRAPVDRDDSNARNDRAERAERRREDDRPEPRSRPRLQ
jgi:hypothetical protein